MFLSDLASEWLTSVPGVDPENPSEEIFIRKSGCGKILLVLLPGNNACSNIFGGVVDCFREVSALESKYTLLSVDFRGSGRSSYNTPIGSLKDFAIDIDNVLNQFYDITHYDIHLVAYSLGFPVGIELVNLNPQRYQSLIGYAPVGTRGVRVEFNAITSGEDSAGAVWVPGDWAPTADVRKGIQATSFHQRSWQGQNRSLQTVKETWDALVFNDYLNSSSDHPVSELESFLNSVAYTSALEECLAIQYMPESLFYAHTFNSSDAELRYINADDSVHVVPSQNKLSVFSEKRVLLIKAESDVSRWLGDMVIDDQSMLDSLEDFRSHGASATYIGIAPGFSYDHGLVVTHPENILALLTAYLDFELTESAAANILSAPVTYLG